MLFKKGRSYLMKYMSLQEIAAACGGTYYGGSEFLPREVSSVVIDSRKAEKDSLFIAIRGARVDGHSFIPKVMEQGALCAVSEEDLGDVPYSYIKVASCEQALKDIAERAGVSMMTVSRVMNSKEGKVSEKTASRIRSLANEMGYIPNSSARSLAAKSSQIIAVILRDSNTFHPLSDPYNASFLGFITREIQKRGFYVMIHFVQDFSDITFRLRSWNAEGAIFLGVFDEEVQKIQNRNKIPLVFIDSYSNVRQLINIGIDDYKGGQLAAEYFLKNGHKTLGFVGPFTKTGGVISKRYQGFSDTLLAHQITLFDKHVYDLEQMDPQDIIDSISHDSCPPTGLFVFSDETALQLINIASNKGWDIPSRLSFIGFDDLPSFCTFSDKLTTIHQDIFRKAETSCNILFEHIATPDKPSENITLDVRLVERNSVCRLS